MSDELSYLGLGLAIGKRFPWILLRKKNDRKWPEVLDGVSAVIYETYKELSESLDTAVKEFARETTPSQKKMDETSGIAILSFWLQLDDWIEEQNAKNLDPKSKIIGSLKLIRSLGIGVVDKYIIPPSSLTLGLIAHVML